MATTSKNQLQQLNDKLASLENAIKGLNFGPNETAKDKKPRNMTDAGALHKAKLIYYQETKNSDEVKKLVKAKNPDMDSISFSNWRVAKAVTDELFNKLPQSKKDEYVKKAQDTE